MNKFLKSRTKSLSYVFKGMLLIIQTEDAIKAQLFVFGVFNVMGLYFNISLENWKWQFFCFGLIFTAEALNTAIEKLCDFIHPDFHDRIGFVKDVSAGAVGFAGVTSFIIGCFIYVEYFF